MTGTAACERLLARLVAAKWEDEDAEDRHAASRGQLVVEYLRRTARWAEALDATADWPFSDLAAALDPGVETDAAWIVRLEAESGHKLGSLTSKVVTAMFRWAALGDLPKERFPDLEDPYEPMIQVFERGGEIWPGHGSIELYLNSVPYRTVAERSAQPPVRIDAAGLDAVDAEYQVRVENADETQPSWSRRRVR